MPSLHNNLTLPCGVVLKNRLAKAAMSDSLGDGVGNPTQAQIRLYEKWAEGGVGISFVGEVQCDPRFPMQIYTTVGSFTSNSLNRISTHCVEN